MSGREALLTGRRARPPAVRMLRAGPVTCLLDGIELREVRREGAELANLLYVAVRDEGWNTIPATVTDHRVDESDDGFRVTFHARHAADAIDLAWDGRITGTADGTIEFTLSGVAARGFRFNRIGFCLLHSVAAVRGRPYRTSGGTDAPPASGVLPTDIAPQRADGERLTGMLAPFRHLEIDLGPERTLVVDLSGDDFEMEDQRNYADSTFKTYSTPLQRPTPHMLEAGEAITRSVRLSSRGAWPARVEAAAEGPVTVHVDAAVGPLPGIGLGVASDGPAMTAVEAERIRSLRPAHLWLTIDPRAEGAEARTRSASGDADAVGTGIVMELLLGPGGDGLDSALSLLASDRHVAGRVRRVMVRAPSDGPVDHGPPDTLVDHVRRRVSALIPGIEVGAMMGQLAALIRRPRDVTPLGTVAIPISPTVHRDDDRTMMDNLAGLDEQVATAVAVMEGRPVHVGPVTLASIHGPWPRGFASLGLPAQVDPRQPSLFAAAWTVGALGGLLAGGAATITLFETVGWRGVMERETGSAAPGRFLSRAGALFPAWYVLADIATHAGGAWRSVRVSDPGRVGAFAVTSAAGTTVDIANLTRDPVEVTVRVADANGGPMSLRMLDADAIDATRSTPIPASSVAPPVGGTVNIHLDAYAIATLRSTPPGRPGSATVAGQDMRASDG